MSCRIVVLYDGSAWWSDFLALFFSYLFIQSNIFES